MPGGPKLLKLGRHDPRQQLVNVVAGVVGDALQDMAQIRLRVDPFQLGRPDQCVDHLGKGRRGLGGLACR